jgi:hypothetical protein
MRSSSTRIVKRAMTSPSSASQRLTREAPRVGDYRRGARLRTTSAGTWFPAVGPDDQPAGLLLVHPGVDLRILVPTIERLAELTLPGAMTPNPGLLEQAGRNWLVTRAPAVPTLADVLDDGTHREPGNAAALLSDVAATLLTTHRAGLSHGALDARSILIGQDGAALLTDWGTNKNATAAGDVGSWALLAELLAQRWCGDDLVSAAALARAVHAANGPTGLAGGFDQLRRLANIARRSTLAQTAKNELDAVSRGEVRPPRRPQSRRAQPAPAAPAAAAAVSPVEPAAAGPVGPALTGPTVTGPAPVEPVEPTTAAPPTPARPLPSPTAPPAAPAPPLPAPPPAEAPRAEAPPVEAPRAAAASVTAPTAEPHAARPALDQPAPDRPAPGPTAPDPTAPGQPAPGRTAPSRPAPGPPPDSHTPEFQPPDTRPPGSGWLTGQRPPAAADHGARPPAGRDTPPPAAAAPWAIPAAAPEPDPSSPRGKRGQVPRWQLVLLAGLVVITLVAAAADLLLLVTRSTGASALKIQSVVLWAQRSGTGCSLLGVITTNGEAGTVTYGWTGDTATGPAVSTQVQSGHSQIEVSRQWNPDTASTLDPLVTLQVLQPALRQASVQPELDCSN